MLIIISNNDNEIKTNLNSFLFNGLLFKLKYKLIIPNPTAINLNQIVSYFPNLAKGIKIPSINCF